MNLDLNIISLTEARLFCVRNTSGFQAPGVWREQQEQQVWKEMSVDNTLTCCYSRSETMLNIMNYRKYRKRKYRRIVKEICM